MENYSSRKPHSRRRVSKARREAFQRKKKDTVLQVFTPLIFFAALVAYEEFIFHIAMFKSIFMFYPIILPLCVGAFFATLTIVSHYELFNKIFGLVITTLTCILCAAEIIYNGVFMDTFFQLFSISDAAGQALDFIGLIMEQFGKHIIAILFLFAPIAVYAVLVFKLEIISYRRKKPIALFYYILAMFVVYLFGIITLKIGGSGEESTYYYYKYNNDVNEEVKRMGVITTNRIDLRVVLFGAKNDRNILGGEDNPLEIPTLPGGELIIPTLPVVNPSQGGNIEVTLPEYEPTTDENGETQAPPETPPAITWDTSPNIINIDFAKLNLNAPSDEIKTMNNYFATQVPTLKNQYTGMFKGYNVIMICAEGFWKYAVDPVRTPTLYKLAHEGFVFNHYYTPLWYGSTNGGEYATLTGTLPKNGGYVSLQETGKRGTNMYMTLGKQLKRIGYTTLGAHNNTSTYYGRDKSIPNMGFDEWFAIGTGFDPEMNKAGTKAKWPQSDERLVTQLLPKYVGKEPFVNYIMTVSGHCNYTKGGNSMVSKNWAKVEELPYTLEETKGYIACHYELENALKTLIDGLEAQGIADRTLIVLTGDHVPYNDKEVCDELAGHVLDTGIEWYESTLIMWSASMKEPVIVDKYCSQIDILPTVSNLLGLEYDSRMMVGQDILSTSAPLVIFKNKSFITDRCIYNGVTGEITQLTDTPIDDAYLKAYRSYINAKWAISEMFIEYDYYSYLEPLLKK